MNLVDDEVEIVLMALQYFVRQADLVETNSNEREICRACCGHVSRKADAIIDRIKQWRVDEAARE